MTFLKDLGVLILSVVLTGSQVGNIHFLIKKEKSLETEKLFHFCDRNYSQEFNTIVERQLCGNSR